MSNNSIQNTSSLVTASAHLGPRLGKMAHNLYHVYPNFFLLVVFVFLSSSTWAQSLSDSIRSTIEKGVSPSVHLRQQLMEQWLSLSQEELQDSLQKFEANEEGLSFRLGAWSYYQNRNLKLVTVPLQKLERTIRIKGYTKLYPPLYANLAQAAFFENDLEKVGQHYSKMLQYLGDLAPSARIKYYIRYIHYCFYNKKDYQEAIRYLEKVRTIAEQEDTTVVLKTVYELLARIYTLWDNHEQADFYANKLLAITKEGEVKQSMALLYKAGWAVEQERWAQAEQYLELVGQQLGVDGAAIGNASIDYRLAYGKYFLQKIDYHWAREEYEEIAGFFQSDDYVIFVNRVPTSEVIRAQGLNLRFNLTQNDKEQLREILEYFEFNNYSAGSTILDFSPLRVEGYFKLGEVAKALALADQTLSALKQGGMEEGEWLMPKVAMQLLHQKASFFAKGNAEQRLQAGKCYQEALELMSIAQQQHAQESFKKQFFEQSDKLLDEAMGFFWEMWKQTGEITWANAGFRVAEQNKANLLQDALHANKALQVGLLPDSLYQQEQDLQRQITFLRTALLEAEQSNNKAQIQQHEQALFAQKEALLKLKKQLASDYPRYYNWRYDRTRIRLSDFQAQLPDSVLVLELYSAQGHLHLLYINKQQLQWRCIPYAQKEEQALGRYLSQLRTWSPRLEEQQIEDMQAYAWKAYQQLLAPVLKKGSYNNLWIIADEKWSHLPFETLLSQAPSSTSLGKAPYLIRDYAVAYQYSAQLWMELKNMEQRATKNLLACLADAPHECRDSTMQCVQRQTLAPLYGAAEEVNFLTGRYAGQFLHGTSATESQFKEACSDYRILHLAMHGKVDTTYPARSALWLHQSSSASSEDDVLHAYELPSLQLSAEIVVLSACETGAGKYLNGEGVLSLGRGFMYAGAQSLVMSMWSVNDQSTAELMRYFYEGLELDLDKAQALRQAKLRYLDAHPQETGHPFFWASFTLTGQTSPVILEKSGGAWSYWLVLSLPILLGLGLVWRYMVKGG